VFTQSFSALSSREVLSSSDAGDQGITLAVEDSCPALPAALHVI